MSRTMQGGPGSVGDEAHVGRWARPENQALVSLCFVGPETLEVSEGEQEVAVKERPGRGVRFGKSGSRVPWARHCPVRRACVLLGEPPVLALVTANGRDPAPGQAPP